MREFVEREFRDYLTCGVADHGFLRLRCDDCGHDRVLPFSCKKRGLCPSCGGRRMSDTAAYLVERVFPWIPTRQGVLSLPFKLRYSDILNIFVRAVFSELRRRARTLLGLNRSQCGAVTVRATLQSGARLERPLPLDRIGWRVYRRSGYSA